MALWIAVRFAGKVRLSVCPFDKEVFGSRVHCWINVWRPIPLGPDTRTTLEHADRVARSILYRGIKPVRRLLAVDDVVQIVVGTTMPDGKGSQIIKLTIDFPRLDAALAKLKEPGTCMTYKTGARPEWLPPE